MQAPTFHNDDDAARYYLSVLRDGADADKIVARERLAAVFERRGMFAEAVELYERNVRTGVHTADLLARLSDAYRQIGDNGSADAALAEARRLHAAQAAAAPRRVIPFPAAPRTEPSNDERQQPAAVASPEPVDDRYAPTAPLPAQPSAPEQLAEPAPSSADIASREALGDAFGGARQRTRRSVATDPFPDDAAPPEAAGQEASAPGAAPARA